MKALISFVGLTLVLAASNSVYAEGGAEALERFHERNRQAHLVQKQKEKHEKRLVEAGQDAKQSAKHAAEKNRKTDG